MVEGVVWPDQTLTQLEGEDWGEPTYPSYVVTNSHRLRYKPLREFTAEDLRFMLGQQNSLPILMPMALDVLDADPFSGGDMYEGRCSTWPSGSTRSSGGTTRGCGIGSTRCCS
jgi:hypothetical protein